MGVTDPAGQATSPKRADARRNYDRLLATAAQAFAEHGADDVSLEEIARRAGVGIGTLYRHFPARQALLEAVYRDQVESLEVLAGKLMAAESPGDALGDWIRAFVAFGRAKRSLSSALVATIGKDSELLSACSLILRNCNESVLQRAQAAGAARPDITGADIFRLTHGLITACPMDAALADPEQADRLISLVIAGLVPASAAPAEPGAN